MKFINKVAPVLLILCIENCFAFSDGDKNKPLQQKHSLKRIVIDAGHGGTPSSAKGNYGASSKFGDEKDITLAVALKLQKSIESELPDVEVVMTRTTDVFESVHVKADKANAAKGDLFITIHCNGVDKKHTEITGYTHTTVKKHGKKVSKKVPIYRTWITPDPGPKGTETFIWAIGKTEQKKDAIAENEFVDTTDAIIKEVNDPVKKVQISLRIQQYATRSEKLAETIEDEFVKAGRVSRGVKQRDDEGIWVLQAVNMPAVLVEIGFLSNEEEGAYLGSENGQQEVADQITQAIKRYKFSLDNKISGKN